MDHKSHSISCELIVSMISNLNHEKSPHPCNMHRKQVFRVHVWNNTNNNNEYMHAGTYVTVRARRACNILMDHTLFSLRNVIAACLFMQNVHELKSSFWRVNACSFFHTAREKIEGERGRERTTLILLSIDGVK